MYVSNDICLITLYQTILTSNNPVKEAFKNIVGKGKNTGNQHNVFKPFQNKFYFFNNIYFWLLLILLIWISAKFCRFVTS